MVSWLNTLKVIIPLSTLMIFLQFHISEKYFKICDLFFSIVLIPLTVLYVSIPPPPPAPFYFPPSQRILQS